MELFSVFVFAIALSMDGLGAGIVYGMRKIKMPIPSLLVVGFASSTAIGISMSFGHLIAQYISMDIAEKSGALILIVMGIRIILQVSGMKRENGCEKRNGNGFSRPIKERSIKKDITGKTGNEEIQPTDEIQLTELKQGTDEIAPPSEEGDFTQVIYLKIKFLGLVIQILREPGMADFDRSGHISLREAFLLSLALAMDAMVAGFGAAMAGFKPFITPFIVGPVSAFCVSMGVYIGRNFAAKWLSDKAAALPGWMLILLGVARVMKI